MSDCANIFDVLESSWLAMYNTVLNNEQGDLRLAIIIIKIIIIINYWIKV
jgi:hypothetical protein